MEAAAIDHPQVVVPPIGATFQGGFYAGRLRIDGAEFALVVAPKFDGEHAPIAWNAPRKALAKAASFCDGRVNTQAMAAAGSALGRWTLGLRIGGFDDWYLPSRDELELCYRAFKPGAAENFGLSGDNPSSVPPGYAYAPATPAQTALEAFRETGAEAFEANWYWTSTQFAGDDAFAWCQGFGTGGQLYDHKLHELRARAVRRVPLR